MEQPRLLDSLDGPTILTGLALAGFGVLTIASSTLGASGSHAELWRAQSLWFAVALAAAIVVVAVDYRSWAGIAWILHGLVCLALLAVVLIGPQIAGTRSWLVLGPFRVQPSEPAKWTTCLALAVYLARRVHRGIGLRQFLGISLIVGTPVALIALQPDYGTALIFVPIAITALVMGGVRWRALLILALCGLLLAPLVWFSLADYQRARIESVLDPTRDPSGVGYQVHQSRIAIGSGGLLGKGLFRGTQSRLNFLPAQHTDFILSVLAEELGFLGISIVLALYYYLFHRGFLAATTAQDRLGTYLCILVVAWLGGQCAINIGMILGRLPTIGVPLPLMSYGGSALVSTLAGVALIVGVRSRRFVN